MEAPLRLTEPGKQRVKEEDQAISSSTKKIRINVVEGNRKKENLNVGGANMREAIEHDRICQMRGEEEAEPHDRILKQEILKCFPKTSAIEFWPQYLKKK